MAKQVSVDHTRKLTKLLHDWADPKVLSREHDTPTHMGCLKGDTAKLNLLREAGANFDLQTLSDWAPLHIGVEKGFVKLLAFCCGLVSTGQSDDLGGRCHRGYRSKPRGWDTTHRGQNRSL